MFSPLTYQCIQLILSGIGSDCENLLLYARSRVSLLYADPWGQPVLHRLASTVLQNIQESHRLVFLRKATPRHPFDRYTSLNVPRAHCLPNFRVYLRRLFKKKRIFSYGQFARLLFINCPFLSALFAIQFRNNRICGIRAVS